MNNIRNDLLASCHRNMQLTTTTQHYKCRNNLLNHSLSHFWMSVLFFITFYCLHTFISYSKVFICWSKNATSILFCLHFFTFCPSCFKAILPQGSKQPRGFTLSSLFEVSASAKNGSLSCGLHLWTPLK